MQTGGGESDGIRSSPPKTLASDKASVRFLVCGDADGELKSLAKNLENVERKQGPFLFAVCVGNFFGNQYRYATLEAAIAGDDFLSGRLSFPLPVYFIDSSQTAVGGELRRNHAKGYQFSPSLQFLGAFGFRELHGLRVGYLSGFYNAEQFFTQYDDEEDIDLGDEDISGNDSDATHIQRQQTVNDACLPNGYGEQTQKQQQRKYFSGPYAEYYNRPVLQALKEDGARFCGSTDVFFSCTWPTGVEEELPPERRLEVAELLALGQTTLANVWEQEGVQLPLPVETSPALSELIELVEPRFHVAAGGHIFYQRPPFRTSTHGLAAKFVGLAHVKFGPYLQTDRRLRFLHALVLKPVANFTLRAPLLAVPSSSTPSPYFTLYNPKAADILAQRRCSDGGVMISPDRLSEDRSAKRIRGTPTMGMTSTPHDRASTSQNPTPPPATCPRSLSFPYSTSLESGGDLASSQKRLKLGSSDDGAGGGTRSPLPPPPPPPDEGCSVYVNNMPFDISEKSLIEILSSFGDIVDAHIPKTAENRSTGRAWITYQTPEQAQKAIAASEHLQSGGRLLRIQRAISGRRHDGTWGERGRSSGGPRRPLAPPCVDVSPHSECWFCLANPNCEKRLVVAVGQQVYVALAKGGMVHQHVLIVPVTHFPNVVFCPPSVTAELDLFVQALRQCYRSQGLKTIVFERFFPMRTTTGMHMQLQVVPIPSKCAQSCVDVFERRAEKAGCPLTPLLPDDTLAVLRHRVPDRLSQPYFYVELPSPDNDDKVERRLFIGSATENLPFNFGREATADLIDVPDRANWKSCVEPPHVELQLAQQMQKLFEPFVPK